MRNTSIGMIRMTVVLLLASIVYTGCATLAIGNSKKKTAVESVMTAWVEGWRTMDRTRLEPLMSDSFFGIFDEDKEETLNFVDRCQNDAETRIRYITDAMSIEVKGNTAKVECLRLEAALKDGWTSNLFIDYTLRCESGGIWRIVKAEWNHEAEKTLTSQIDPR